MWDRAPPGGPNPKMNFAVQLWGEPGPPGPSPHTPHLHQAISLRWMCYQIVKSIPGFHWSPLYRGRSATEGVFLLAKMLLLVLFFTRKVQSKALQHEITTLTTTHGQISRQICYTAAISTLYSYTLLQNTCITHSFAQITANLRTNNKNCTLM